MKKKLGIIVLATVAFFMTGCKKQDLKSVESNLRKLENLVVLETYSHNIADFTKKAEKGFWNFLDKDMELWIEYTGTAKIGIDLKEIKIEKKLGKIKIFVPKTKVLDVNIKKEDFNENSFYSSKDGLFNKNKLTIEDAQKAVSVAQDEMKKILEKDKEMLKDAQLRAKDMIESLFNRFGFDDIEWELEAIE